MKFVPDRFQTEIAVYADSVMLYSPVKPIGGVIIRNEKTANSMRALFNMLWRLLPEG